MKIYYYNENPPLEEFYESTHDFAFFTNNQNEQPPKSLPYHFIWNVIIVRGETQSIPTNMISLREVVKLNMPQSFILNRYHKFSLNPDRYYIIDHNKSQPRPFLIAVIGCHHRLNKYIYQQSILYSMYCFIGTPELNSSHLIDEKNHIVHLKCFDDYLNLPNKVYNMIEFVHKYMPHIKGIYKTDDDIVPDLMKLDLTMRIKNSSVWSIHVWKNIKGVSSYLIDENKTQLFEKYPLLKKYPIHTGNITILSGNGYYLRRDVFPLILKQSQLFLPFTGKLPVVNNVIIAPNLLEDVSISRVLTYYNIPIEQFNYKLRLQ